MAATSNEAPSLPGRTCPSGRCRDGATLIGIVGVDGVVGYVAPRMTIDQEFVDRARTVGIPESRFRFAEPCVEGKCSQWAATSCGLIARVLASPQAGAIAETHTSALPACTIRASCRWFAQEGGHACGICPHVVHTPWNRLR